MLREQPELLREDPVRDMDLWRRMYLPADHVRVGYVTAPAAQVPAAQYCWGCTWLEDGLPGSAVAVCLRASALVRNCSCAESMTRCEILEVMVGRIRAAGWPLLLVVDDGNGGMEAWIDAIAAEYRLLVSQGRCPGGRNLRTGPFHRVLWAYHGLWEPWDADDWATLNAACRRPVSTVERRINWTASLRRTAIR
jgi:hypothetical protein